MRHRGNFSQNIRSLKPNVRFHTFRPAPTDTDTRLQAAVHRDCAASQERGPDMTDNDQGKLVTYIERRIQKGKLQHCFLEDGIAVWWPKIRASIFTGARIGTTYQISERFPGLWSEIAVGEVDEQTRFEWQAATGQTSRSRMSAPDPQVRTSTKRLKQSQRRVRRCPSLRQQPLMRGCSTRSDNQARKHDHDATPQLLNRNRHPERLQVSAADDRVP